MVARQRLARRLLSTAKHYPSTAGRELAQPVTILSSKNLDGGRDKGWSSWISNLTKAGYSCLDVAISQPNGASLSDYEQEIAIAFREAPSPFPPLLCAYGLSTLLAEQYVSSHPLTGLLLVDPPLSVSAARRLAPSLKLDDVADFDYEPNFPLAILTSRTRAKELETHRLRRDYSDEVNLLVTNSDDVFSEDAFNRFRDWMDSNGL